MAGSNSSSASTSDLNQFWISPSTTPLTQLKSIRKRLPTFSSPALRVSRVGQLDASLLDHELESILAGPIWKALELLKVNPLSVSRCHRYRFGILTIMLTDSGTGTA